MDLRHIEDHMTTSLNLLDCKLVVRALKKLLLNLKCILMAFEFVLALLLPSSRDTNSQLFKLEEERKSFATNLKAILARI